MALSTGLSSLPMERLKSFVQNVGEFAWDDTDRVGTIVKNLCGPLHRESDLLIRSIHEGVPAALRRAFEREPNQLPEVNVALVAKHLSKRLFLDLDDCNWAVHTLAAAIGYVPVGPLRPIELGKSSPAPPPDGYSYQSQQPSGAPDTAPPGAGLAQSLQADDAEQNPTEMQASSATTAE